MKRDREPPGVKNGVIVDAAYWLWVDRRKEQAYQRRVRRLLLSGAPLPSLFPKHPSCNMR